MRPFAHRDLLSRDPASFLKHAHQQRGTRPRPPIDRQDPSVLGHSQRNLSGRLLRTCSRNMRHKKAIRRRTVLCDPRVCAVPVMNAIARVYGVGLAVYAAVALQIVFSIAWNSCFGRSWSLPVIGKWDWLVDLRSFFFVRLYLYVRLYGVSQSCIFRCDKMGSASCSCPLRA